MENKHFLEKILLVVVGFLILGAIFWWLLSLRGAVEQPYSNTPQNTAPSEQIQLTPLPQEKESTPEEIDNSVISELDTLMQEIQNDDTLSDTLSDLELEE